MKILAIVSTVGGAGRTTLTAELASLLVARGNPVLAIECDPRNVLGMYFGMETPPKAGLSSPILATASEAWADAGFVSDDGVLFVPWGSGGVDGEALARMDRDPNWLRKRLALVALPAHGVALVDTATWPSVQASQAIAAADLVLVLTPPAPAVCATLESFRQAMVASGTPCAYVANLVNPARQLHADIMALLRTTLGPAMLPYPVHQDEGVPEAFTRNEAFHLSSPHSQAAHDLHGLASWVSGWINGGAQGAPA